MIDKKKLLSLATWGQIDGGHHKMWVIDQMVRALCGCPELAENEFGVNEEYCEFVRKYKEGGEGRRYYSWDIGIAP